MEFSGTVQGAAAHRYGGFTYRKPVPARVDIWQLDPERLHPAHECPRSVNPPSQPSLQVVELADYVMKVGAAGGDGMSAVQVWMWPNEYTAAKSPFLVFEVAATPALASQCEWRHEVLARAFGQSRRHAVR